MSNGAAMMRHYRKRIPGMSQDALAKAVGITTGAISQIEREVNAPSYKTAAAIDEALDAGGAVMEAFGFSAAPANNHVTREEFDALRESLRALAGGVSRLSAQLFRQGTVARDYLTDEANDSARPAVPSVSQPRRTARKQNRSQR